LLQDELRSKITYVSQDTILFHKSILENIRYSKSDASNKEVKEASVIAHCDEFINELQN
jgi:ATP-binding cassette subfamily B protein